TLRQGYLAVVRATDEQVNPATLCVHKDRLCRKAAGGGAPQRLTNHDYLLFKLEVSADRDDWRSLTAIDNPFRAALTHLAARKTKEAQEELTAAVVAVMQTRELTEAHRTIVIEQMRQKYASYEEQLKKKGLVAAAEGSNSLEAVMQTAPDPVKTYRRPITLAEALSGLLSDTPPA